jgi:hypothetical protein
MTCRTFPTAFKLAAIKRRIMALIHEEAIRAIR